METKVAAAAKSEAYLPLVVSFTILEKGGFFYAVAIQSRGGKILGEQVMDTDSSKKVILDSIDRESRRYYIHGISPFDPKED